MAIQGDQARTAHLLRRFGLGASQAELDYYSAGGWKMAVERLLDCDSVDEQVVYTTDFLMDQEGRMPPNPRQTQAVIHAWLLTTMRPLQAKMTLFWHDHFATSVEKVSNGPAMYKHWNTLWEGSLGNFEDLLQAISKDPAMLYWLDNIDNVKGQANENFARELMELFTLGVDQYSENDVQEVARAFTGWSFGFESPSGRVRPNRGRVPRISSTYVFDEQNHDFGDKVFMGEKKAWNGDDVIKALCKKPRTAQFLVEKLWSYFAYEKPSRALVERHAQSFLESDLDIKTVLRGMMLDEEFYSDKADRKMVKSPIDYCVSTMRQLGIGRNIAASLEGFVYSDGQAARSRLQVARVAQFGAEAMGMSLLGPPDVAGWPNHTQWVSTATMVERIKWSESLFTTRGASQLALGAIATEGANGEQLVANMLSVFDAELGDEKRARLISYAEEALGGEKVSASNSSEVCSKVARLLFSTPEFQMM